MKQWIINKNEGILCNNRLLVREQLINSIQVLKFNSKFSNNDDFVAALVPALKNLQAALHFYDTNPIYKNLADDLITGINNVELSDVSEMVSRGIKDLNGDFIQFQKSISGANFDRALATLDGSIRKLIKGLKNPKVHTPNGLMNDYNRIVYSSAFRRLQHKAQVFSLEKYDYARTRLTHTMEVSSVAANIGNLCAISVYQKRHEDVKKNMAFQFEKICSCAALLHDIGNPPFGHFGEEAIKRYFSDNWDNLQFATYDSTDTQGKKSLRDFFGNKHYSHMKSDFVKFDGNAQGFRVATKIQMYKPNHALELTASVLGGMLKYPHSSIANYPKDKFGYFYSETQYIEELKALGVFAEGERNPIVYLVEASDDISYVTSDFDDIVKKGVLTYEDFVKELNSPNNKFADDSVFRAFKNNFTNYYEYNKKLSDHPFELTIQRMTNDLRSELISEIIDIFTDKLKSNPTSNNKETNKFIFDIEQNNCEYVSLLDLIPSTSIVQWIKSLFKSYVYTNRGIISTELSGAKILTSLLNDFVQAVLQLDFRLDENNQFHFLAGKCQYAKEMRVFSLISKNFVETFKKETEEIQDVNSLEHVYYRLKLVLDYISGMTDSYAEEIYHILNGMS